MYMCAYKKQCICVHVRVLCISFLGISPVSFEDWMRIDAREIEIGEAVGKPREKIVSVAELMRTAHH